ncbi:MAG: putative peptidoglycan glycosyltransferase FtsW [bacterium]|nr:putative peptidoglycan glycosyltransferase FtsW [bacterium]MCY3924479.1 putative peptidoglycan glycosyltransferase FtsW [bacterium]
MSEVTSVTAGGRSARPMLRPPAGRRSGTFVGLVVVVAILCVLGLVMVLTSSTVTSIDSAGTAFHHARLQGMWLAMGLVAGVVTLRVDYHRWRAPLLTGGAVAAVLAALAFLLFPSPLVITVNGSSRWVRLAGFVVQPSEAAKLALVLFAASLLSRRFDDLSSIRAVLLPLAAVFGAMSALILAQPSLGTVVLLAGILFVMLFMAGIPARQLAWLMALGGGAILLFTFLFSYRRQRLASFFDPWSDPYGVGYQIVQAQVGIASGGLTGLGPGGGRASLAFLPYAHTDFIYVVVAEELGLLGAGVVVGAFFCLGALGVRAVRDAPDPYGAFLAAGITGWLVLQAFSNIAVAQGLLPTMGVPLPFISYGGSSLVVNLAAAGILMNVARQGRSR